MKNTASEFWRGALRYLVAVLLIWASISKLANPTDFLAAIYAYQTPFPQSVLKWLAVTLPWVELLCALLLLSNHWTGSALLCCLILFVVFIVATGQAWARGLHISCGCFDLSLIGLGPKYSRVQAVLESVSFAFFRNVFFAGLVGWLWRDTVKRERLSSPSPSLPLN
ncbi:MAG: DoxX family membrane protein [Candidatus Omnitrophica bacterium]|nr:DoxX family membrane protein [Candidatus Omnitrophota bacterium]